ncbi:hypothetical protein U6X16_04045 [Bacillus velezensis]|uniref:hypothetical protein n=1 Tax=Bacillus velezensis TaxID=492670 RepID=UPI002ADE3283|nr:hypothetical protein [Bacillus velezensis]MEA1004871.1 hypothetical protein [Bacillus velezensis]
MQLLMIFIVHILSALIAAAVYVYCIDYDGYYPYILISAILFIFYLIFARDDGQRANNRGNSGSTQYI